LGPLDRMAAEPPRLDRVLVDAAGELLAQGPLAPRRDDDLEAGQVAVEDRRLREGHPQRPTVGAVPEPEDDRPLEVLDGVLALRIDPALLYLEQVGEVRLVG